MGLYFNKKRLAIILSSLKQSIKLLFDSFYLALKDWPNHLTALRSRCSTTVPCLFFSVSRSLPKAQYFKVNFSQMQLCRTLSWFLNLGTKFKSSASVPVLRLSKTPNGWNQPFDSENAHSLKANRGHCISGVALFSTIIFLFTATRMNIWCFTF